MSLTAVPRVAEIAPVTAPGYALRMTGAVTARHLRNIARQPWWIAISLIQPLIWLLLCWRVYRVIHGVSALRSAFAYVVAFAGVVLLAPLLTLVLRGLYGGNLPPIK